LAPELWVGPYPPPTVRAEKKDSASEFLLRGVGHDTRERRDADAASQEHSRSCGINMETQAAERHRAYGL
jgi:hypothetical protein